MICRISAYVGLCRIALNFASKTSEGVLKVGPQDEPLSLQLPEVSWNTPPRQVFLVDRLPGRARPKGARSALAARRAAVPENGKKTEGSFDRLATVFDGHNPPNASPEPEWPDAEEAPAHYAPAKRPAHGASIPAMRAVAGLEKRLKTAPAVAQMLVPVGAGYGAAVPVVSAIGRLPTTAGSGIFSVHGPVSGLTGVMQQIAATPDNASVIIVPAPGGTVPRIAEIASSHAEVPVANASAAKAAAPVRRGGVGRIDAALLRRPATDVSIDGPREKSAPAFARISHQGSPLNPSGSKRAVSSRQFPGDPHPLPGRGGMSAVGASLTIALGLLATAAVSGLLMSLSFSPLPLLGILGTGIGLLAVRALMERLYQNHSSDALEWASFVISMIGIFAAASGLIGLAATGVMHLI